MLSEEEKAVLKKLFEEVIQTKEKSDIRLKINKQVAQYLLNCINSLEQLEKDKQDLIKKLEKDISKHEWSLEEYDCTISDYKQSQAVGACIALQKILEIIKGEEGC